MSEPSWEEFQSEHKEVEKDPLQAALELHEDSTEAYYMACGAYARKPIRRNIPPVIEARDTQVEAFSIVAETITTSTPNAAALSPDEIIGITVKQLTEVCANRAEYFNKIIGKPTFEAPDFSFTKGEVSLDEVEPGELREVLVIKAIAAFSETLGTDTSVFIEMVRTETQVGRQTERIEQIKIHASEIGKIAAGTALGIAAAQFLNRKH